MPYCIPVVHPAAVLRGGRPITDIIAADLAKAHRISEEGLDFQEHILHVIPGNPMGIAQAFTHATKWMQHWLDTDAVLGVDVETSGLEYFNCKLYSVALGDAESSVAVSFTLMDLHTLPAEYEIALIGWLRAILASPRITKVYHNAPFDRAVLTRKGFRIEGKMLDTMGLMHLIQPDIQKDLGWCGHTFLDVGPWKLDHESGKMANTKNPIELLIYNAKDALYTAKMVKPMTDTIYRRGMSSELISWQMAFNDLATDMELYGIPINFDRRHEMGLKIREGMQERLAWMRDFLRWPDFNPMSQAHRIEALYGKRFAGDPWKLGFMPKRFTKKTNSPSTSYKALIDNLEHPMIRRLAAYMEDRHTFATMYRERTVTKSKKGKEKITAGAYQRAIYDGRLHPKWNPVGTTGSRFSSNPNCFDAETEILTSAGWIGLKTVVKQPGRWKVAQLTPFTWEVDGYVEPTGYFDTVLHRGDDVANLFNEYFYLRMTPNHRLVMSLGVNQVMSVQEFADAQLPARMPKLDSKLRPYWVHVDPRDVEFNQLGTDEHFYCVSVPSGFIAVRRRGQTAIVGNCQNMAYKHRAFIEAPDGRVLVSSDKCLGRGTMIETLLGPKAIENVVVGDKVYTHRDGKITWGEVTASKPTGLLECYEITLDSGDKVIASEDHKWPVRIEGKEVVKRTSELEVGTRMVPFKRFSGKKPWPYYSLYSSSHRLYSIEHHIIAEAFLGPRPEGCYVHHINGDGHDNRPENLKYIPAGEHASRHSRAAYWTYDHTLRKQRALEAIADRRSYAGSGNPNYKGGRSVVANCLYCGKEFRSCPSQEKRYCSKDCYFAARKRGLNHKIAAIRKVGLQETFAITVEPDHNYVLSIGVVTMNSQLELRLVAVRSGVRELLEEMRKVDGDPHTLAAINIYGDEFLRKDKGERAVIRGITKTVVYASVYLAGVETVWRTCRERKQLDPALRAMMTLPVVRHIHRSYFGRYHEIFSWHESNMRLVKSQGYLEIPPFKRRRYYPVQPPPATEIASWTIQPCGSDIVGMEMCMIQDELKKRYHGDASVILHGHDQVVVECPAYAGEDVKKLVHRIFGCTPFDGPAGPVDLTADVKVGKTLLDVK